MVISFFGKRNRDDSAESKPAAELPEEQQERLEQDVYILDDSDGSRNLKLQKVAEREVLSAAEDSVRKMHVIKLGRCPNCGEHLYQHMAANICVACGWHNYDCPKQGRVKIHLRQNGGVVIGERAYVLPNGDCLVVYNDVVSSRVPAAAYDWIEYIWNEEELEQRRQQFSGKLKVSCGWCGSETDPSKDGFHLVHVAFGNSQERYCFCSDDCLDAFRKMYPARVHRNCYERNCAECNMCQKRYGDEAEGVWMLAKDYLRFKKNEDSQSGKNTTSGEK